MTGDPYDGEHREERRRVLAALLAATADPVRLTELIQDAVDDEEAARRLAAEFGLEPDQARGVLDQSIRLLTPSRRAALAEELRILDAEWGPPLELDLRFTTRRSASMTVDGAERTFRGGAPNSVREQALAYLREHVTRPRLRPVVLTETGLPNPAQWAVRPDGSASAEYADS